LSLNNSISVSEA